MKNSTNWRAFLFIAIFLPSLIAMCAQQTVKVDKEKIPTIVEKQEKVKPTIIAVVDTGFDLKSEWTDLARLGLVKPRICKYGHKDFTGYGLQDVHGHGTHVSGLIAKYAETKNYCLVILKYYHEDKTPGSNMNRTLEAFQRAIDLKVDVINYSGGGVEKSEEECNVLKEALDMGITVVVAAGNEGSDINKKPYYPAMCDERIVAVGNIYNDGKLGLKSNYSNSVEIDARGLYYEKGFQVLSIGLNNGTANMTGTSQAAGIRTGKIVKSLNTP